MQLEANKVRELFLDAVENHSPGSWRAFLQQACAGDQELNRQVQVLLVAHQQSHRLLDLPDQISTSVLAAPPMDSAGTTIGPYKLLEQIGEGGMGVVWMAEQSHPVKRKVALKIIKPGMDSQQIIARFEAERQALALMDHPNIAKVHDAGTTDSGRPYFLMELVKGVPITKYCDDHRLTPRRRLELFIPVCQAVQHAHQKGIIHRDLKPSNVLVAEYDEKPVVKVIDFGVAKAVGSQLTEQTLFTKFGQIIGTLEYMSPEQAKFNALDVDTRCDIYSLGVLLYELLTGTTPFDKKQIALTAFDEMLRIIREEEPQKPSTRLSTFEGLPSVAANRSLEPKKLTGVVRGELDWIVMKCLEKERGRRYETANELVSELHRFLTDEPIIAGPPSSLYRLRKFVRRNHGRVIGVILIGITVLIGLMLIIIVLSVSNDRISREKSQAAEQRDRALENRTTMVMAVFEVLGPLDTIEWRTDPKLSKVRAAMLDKASQRFQAMIVQDQNDPSFRREIGCAFLTVANLYEGFGEREKSIVAYRIAFALLEGIPEEFRQDEHTQKAMAPCYYNFGHALLIVGRRDEARAAFQKAVTAILHTVESFPDYWSIDMTGWILSGCQFSDLRGNPAVAIEMAKKAVALKPEIHNSWMGLGAAYYRAGQLDAAYQALEEAMRRHPRGGEGFIWLYLAMIEWDRGNREEARRWFQRTVDWLPQPNLGAHPVELTTLVQEAARKLGVPAPKIL
jgi:serine/threonine protein kinase